MKFLHPLKTSLSILFIFCCNSLVFAQNYQLVDGTKRMTFTKRDVAENDSLYFFVQTDSILIDGMKEIYYFQKSIDTTALPYCAVDTNLLGVSMHVLNDADGTHLFFNRNNDTITIKSIVLEGDTWQFFKWANGDYVQAEVVNKLPLGILPGISDSVTRILLHVFTADNVPMDDVFPSNFKIDISKNYGLVELLDFNQFPEAGDAKSLLLRGITEPDTAIVDVTSSNAFNFNLGDEFHYKEIISTLPDGGTEVEFYTNLYKYFVLAKVQYIDSVQYTMQRALWQYYSSIGGPDTQRVIDTISLTYTFTDYTFLDTIELKPFQKINVAYSDFILNDTIFAGFAHKYVYDWFAYDETTECLTNETTNNMPQQVYGDGLGVMHYFDSTNSENYYALDLVFFHKGLTEWGDEIDFEELGVVQIPALQQQFTLEIMPNPVHSILTIVTPFQFEFDAEIKVFSIDGKIVYQSPYSPTISVENLNPGCYFISVNNTRQWYTGKLIKN